MFDVNFSSYSLCASGFYVRGLQAFFQSRHHDAKWVLSAVYQPSVICDILVDYWINLIHFLVRSHYKWLRGWGFYVLADIVCLCLHYSTFDSLVWQINIHIYFYIFLYMYFSTCGLSHVDARDKMIGAWESRDTQSIWVYPENSH